jgi:ABC-type glycerol-3-phosphate transport system substrate-binding protein
MPRPGELPSLSVQQLFLNGHNAMMVDNPARISLMRQMATFDWDIHILPKYREPAVFMALDSLWISSLTKHPEAAFDFIKFLQTPEIQNIIGRLGQVPVQRSAVANANYHPDLSRWVFAASAEVGVATFTNPRYSADVERIFKEEWRESFERNRTPVENAVVRLDERLNALFGR